MSSLDRFEFRAVDSMMTPYLMRAAPLKSSDDGRRQRIDPGSPEERNFAEVAADEVARSAPPGPMYEVYDWYKRDEWEKFIWRVSGRDVKSYLDCLPWMPGVHEDA